MYPLRNLVSIMISRMHACPYSYPFSMQTEMRQFDWLISRIRVFPGPLERTFRVIVRGFMLSLIHRSYAWKGGILLKLFVVIISSHMLRMQKICKSYYEEVYIILNIEFSQNLCFYLRHTLPVS